MQVVEAPLIEVMGGIRLSASEMMIRDTAARVSLLGICSLPIWLVLAIVARASAVPIWPLNRIAENSSRSSSAIWVFAWASVLVWLPVLLVTQPEQLQRRHAEEIYEQHDLRDFLAELSSHKQSDFPPLYEPPPRVSHSRRGELLKLIEIITEEPTADWVREVYLEKFSRALHGRFIFLDSDWERAATLLSRLPEGHALIEELKTDEDAYRYGLERFLKPANEKEEKEQEEAPPK
jgi:hypothetical protein